MNLFLTRRVPEFAKANRSLATCCLVIASVFAGAVPARAQFQVSIDPIYGSSNSPATGVTATLDFYNFADVGSGKYSFDLDLTNTSPSPITSTFVGAVFNLPDDVTTSLADYDPLSSDFYELFLPASLNLGGGPQLYDVGIRTGTAPKSLESPPSQFNGGNPGGGVTVGNTSTVSFVVDASASSLTSLGLFESSFEDLLLNSGLQSAGRFQQVNCNDPSCTVIVMGGSDKVGGGPGDPQGPPPTESAPGPLPLLGIGAAFAYSRKLRHRIVHAPAFSPHITKD